MPHDSRLLTVGEAPAAAEVLARAFFDDPLQAYFLPDEKDRLPRGAPVFQALVTYACLHAEVLTTAPDVTAAALWMPPECWEMTEEGMAKAGFDELPEVMGEAAFSRFVDFFGYVEEHHKRDAADPHWYLAVIGVDPPRQGQGVGSSLIRPILERADSQRVACYLETAQPANVPFYQGLGFRVLADEVEPKSGVRFWTFRRDPGAAS